MPAIFHLTFPVNDLQESEAFYVQYFNAKVGRRAEHWIDILFFGHQLTLHQQPQQVFSKEHNGVRHFGAVIEWREWLELGETLLNRDLVLQMKPTVKFAGTPKEQGKFMLNDPSGNLIEIKSYKDFEAVFGKDEG